METQNLNIFENGLDERSKAYLLETTRWTKFLAILGFIVMGLLILGSIAVITMGSTLFSMMPGSSYSAAGTFTGIGIGLLYLIIAALYLFPLISLFKFSTCIKQGIQTNNAELVTEGFRHQKSLYKFMGILAIIVISFYLLIFIIAGLGLAFSRR